MSKIVIPPGYALVRTADLAAMHAAAQAPAPSSAAPQPCSATMPGLAEAIALLAARQQGIDSPGLSGDVPAGAVAAALTVIAAALLANLLPPDRGAALLAALGVIAVDGEDAPP